MIDMIRIRAIDNVQVISLKIHKVMEIIVGSVEVSRQERRQLLIQFVVDRDEKIKYSRFQGLTESGLTKRVGEIELPCLSLYHYQHVELGPIHR